MKQKVNMFLYSVPLCSFPFELNHKTVTDHGDVKASMEIKVSWFDILFSEGNKM